MLFNFWFAVTMVTAYIMVSIVPDRFWNRHGMLQAKKPENSFQDTETAVNLTIVAYYHDIYHTCR